MHLLIVTSEFPPLSGGGISTYGREFTRALVQAGHTVTVCLPNDQSRELIEDSYNGAHVVKVPLFLGDVYDNCLGWWQLYSYRIAGYIRSTLERGNIPDAIELHDYGAAGYYLLKSRLLEDGPLRCIPVVSFCHGPMFDIAASNEVLEYKFPSYWTGRLEKFCLMASDAIVTPGNFLQARLSDFNSNAFVSGLPYSVDTRPSHSQGSTRDFDLLYLGRTQIGKGILELLRALEILWDRGERIKLRVVGGDTIWHSRERQVRPHIESIYGRHIESGLLLIEDAKSPAQLSEVFAAAKALVVPSRYDNFPYTCIEGMAHGLPVVGSPHGGHAELIGRRGDRGVVLDFDEPDNAANDLSAFLARGSSQLAQAGRNAQEYIEVACNPASFVAKRVEHMLSIRPFNSVNGRRVYPFVNDAETPPPSRQAPATHHTENNCHLTVIVPYYNLHETIDETLASIMASDFDNIDVVLVNDGSNNVDSIAKIEEIESKSYRFPVRVFSIRNGGLPSARNYGASVANGDYIAFLDADDKVRPSYYRSAISVLNTYDNVSFTYSWLQYFENSSSVWITYDTDLPYLLCSNMLSATLVLNRRDFLRFGQNSPKMKYGMEDYEAWLRMVANGCRGVAIPALLTDYRVRSNSMSRQFTASSVNWLYQTLVDLNADTFRSYGPEVAKLLYANGPGRLWNNPSQSYPEVGYLEGEVGHSYRTLVGSFTMLQRTEIQKLLFDPTARRVVVWALNLGLHRKVLGLLKGVLWLRDRLRRKRAPRRS